MQSGRRAVSFTQYPWRELLHTDHSSSQTNSDTRPALHLTRASLTHPLPNYSIPFPDLDLTRLSPAETQEAHLRSFIHDLLCQEYNHLTQWDYLYLCRWVCSRYPMDLTFPLSSTTILQLAQLCPLHLSPTDRPLLQQEREPFPLPIPPSSSPCGALPSSDQSPNAIIIHPRHTSSGSLTFSGLGSHLWAAQDCGDFLSFGTGLSRANSCVFLAIGSSLSIQPDVLATQVRREAALFRASLPVPLPSHLSELSSQALMHLHDLFTINHPIDPVSLALWSPSCLRHRHLIFVQCNSPTTAVRVVSLSATVDPSKVPLRSAGFVLLYRRHAWCLSPPEAIRSLSLATWKHLLAPSEDIFSHLPFGHWRSFLPLSSPPPPTYPWPPLAPCSFCSSPSWSFGGGGYLCQQCAFRFST